MTAIIDIVRARIGRRHIISRQTAIDLLQMLHDRRLVDVENDWADRLDRQPGLSWAHRWAAAVDGITVVSIMPSDTARASSSNPGTIRYDDPGSMHPMLTAEVMLVADGEHHRSTIDWLRGKATRVLMVCD